MANSFDLVASDISTRMASPAFRPSPVRAALDVSASSPQPRRWYNACLRSGREENFTGETGLIEAVIFDVDGTLVDSVDLHARAWQEAFARFGKEIPYGRVR